ncbi:DNA-deoxyinosine glycosylase [Flavobacterium pectinovorum]|uniref:DNA-deoxyinosine glycosylase n=1 Tax=Flavobacterium pectinovorum TaxID=29533 RepID=A0AB36P8J0_9FLAO|nr:DNA-deoxyinosine glycosylase [Flavobacterium pectinovorum]OXB08180.1 DNA-deoxyinosine glycosylase [Flavobacterium pectinovorum]SHN15232.1 G/U mismatch-specific uracil-DNA glycosylase [Flavobacterium pectinovorum]
MKSFSFAPITSNDANILILGTMPGTKSLEINQYYGHKQNNFWKFMFTILKEDFSDNYPTKKALLQKNKIALWDVLQFCERVGSLDSAIKNEIANDFETFLKNHPNIKTILFNGQKAAAFFKKYVHLQKEYQLITLPSSSPANASKTFQSKLEEWKIIETLI